MPNEWHNWHAANAMDDEQTSKFYCSIVADKKPYFMRYIYADLMKRYNKYISNTNKSALRRFDLTVEELQNIPETERTEEKNMFLRYYEQKLPIGLHDCVMNRICRKFEAEFDGYVKRQNAKTSFNYEMLKSDATYSQQQYYGIKDLYEDYNKELANYKIFASADGVDSDEAQCMMSALKEDFTRKCSDICSDSAALCNIALDLCYTTNTSKQFVWDICGETIVQNLLSKHAGQISYPEKCDGGEIVFGGMHFTLKTITVEDNT